MPERKLTIYQRNTGKPIILTDKMTTESITELRCKLENILSGDNKIIKFQTIDDCLIIRTDEIGGIMLSAEGQFKDEIPSPQQMAKSILSDVSSKKTIKETLLQQPSPEIPVTAEQDYEQILVIEEDSKK
jgi:hypothetical protein